jgi:hypothetical protein
MVYAHFVVLHSASSIDQHNIEIVISGCISTEEAMRMAG